ncbi:hypothetical protein NSTC745_06321 [Nostoc sp. DSM 114161]|jgi:hypothetical protein|uniref:hypothetical protein n=1 Tax=Nostoc sp. DSM 114161 TaxID=3440143 RepID=UPI00404550CF
MAYTKAELFQHFEGEYTQAQIIKGLTELAKIDSSINPDGDEFDESIVEQLEDTFCLIQDAVDKQKLLAAKGETLVPVEQIAMELAQGQASDTPIQVFKGFVDIVAGEAIARAVLEHQISETVYNQTLTDLDVKSLEAKNQQAANRIALMSHLIQNPQTVERILEDYGINSNANTQTQLLETTTSCTLEFNPEEFLLEVGAPKKSQTIPDTQMLTKQLLKRYRQD